MGQHFECAATAYCRWCDQVNEADEEEDDDEREVALSDGEGQAVRTTARKLHFGKIRHGPYCCSSVLH